MIYVAITALALFALMSGIAISTLSGIEDQLRSLKGTINYQGNGIQTELELLREEFAAVSFEVQR